MTKTVKEHVAIECSRLRAKVEEQRLKIGALTFKLNGMKCRIYSKDHYIAALEKQIDGIRAGITTDVSGSGYPVRRGGPRPRTYAYRGDSAGG